MYTIQWNHIFLFFFIFHPNMCNKNTILLYISKTKSCLHEKGNFEITWKSVHIGSLNCTSSSANRSSTNGFVEFKGQYQHEFEDVQWVGVWELLFPLYFFLFPCVTFSKSRQKVFVSWFYFSTPNEIYSFFFCLFLCSMEMRFCSYTMCV